MTKTSTDNNKVTWEHSPFMELFSSAVVFYEKSKTEQSNTNLFARESIINCVFALEAAANCTIDRLDLSRKFHDDIDKLSTINKFELFIHTEFQNIKLDRGNTIVQKVEELITLRNNFVHPRHVRISGEYVTGTVYKANKITKKNVTQISNLSTQWTTNDAKNSIEAITNFFKYFFIDLCKYSEEHVSGILCTKNHHTNGTSHWIISRELMEAFKILTSHKMLKKHFMKIPDGDYDISFINEEESK